MGELVTHMLAWFAAPLLHPRVILAFAAGTAAGLVVGGSLTAAPFTARSCFSAAVAVFVIFTISFGTWKAGWPALVPLAIGIIVLLEGGTE